MGFRSKKRVIAAKTPGELDAMQAAGEIVGRALQAVKAEARVGMTTHDLDQIAETIIREAGAIPTFLGYQGFPASICTSVNEVIVHGIPSKDVVLEDGDLVPAVRDGFTLVERQSVAAIGPAISKTK